MAEAKPFASLTSTLLARKGQAKPAMRPQGYAQLGHQDDLGWNDMGYTRPRPVHADEPIGLTPAPLPEVVRQQAEIATEFAAVPEDAAPVVIDAAPEAASAPVAMVVAPAPEASPIVPSSIAPPSVAVLPVAARVKAGTVKARAAFTLRLDPERHLKLRLASAVTRRSAQQLVTEALDTFLQSMPEIEAAAGQLPGAAGGQR